MSVKYVLLGQLSALIPPQFLTEALDDDGDGVADPGVFDSIVDTVHKEIDGALGQRYPVPFSNPIPAVVADAAIVLTAHTLYSRRAVEDKKNPFDRRAKEVREKLAAIAKGEQPLAPEAKRAKPSASIVSEPSKTRSGRNAI